MGLVGSLSGIDNLQAAWGKSDTMDFWMEKRKMLTNDDSDHQLLRKVLPQRVEVQGGIQGRQSMAHVRYRSPE